MSEPEIDRLVASRLRALRRERRMTLAELGALTGMSAAHLSRLEKGDRQPSIGSLLQLARVYGVSVGALVDQDEQDEFQLLRAGEVTTHRSTDGEYSVLSGARGTLAVMRLRMRAGGHTAAASHSGEEWLHVLDGTVRLHLAGRTIELGEGDSLHFDANLSHALATARRSRCTVLIASTSPGLPTQHPLPTAVP